MKLIIKNSIGENLVIRDSIKNILSNDLIVDFTGVVFMSRAFAHQYMIEKAMHSNITEINIPTGIQKMFNVVKKSLVEK